MRSEEPHGAAYKALISIYTGRWSYESTRYISPIPICLFGRLLVMKIQSEYTSGESLSIADFVTAIPERFTFQTIYLPSGHDIISE